MGVKQTRKKLVPLAVFSDMSQAFLVWKNFSLTPFVARVRVRGWPDLCEHCGVHQHCFQDESEAKK